MIIYENEEEGIKLTTYKKNDGELIIFFDGSITDTFIMHIVDELNSFEDNPKFILVLNSEGGEVTQIKQVIPFLKTLGITSLVTVGQLSSAALAIALEAKKHDIPVCIDELCHVVLHRCMTMGILEERSERMHDVIKDWSEQVEKLFDSINTPIMKKLTTQQKKDYKDGRNVYILGIDIIKWGVFDKLPKNFFSVNTNTKKTKKDGDLIVLVE